MHIHLPLLLPQSYSLNHSLHNSLTCFTFHTALSCPFGSVYSHCTSPCPNHCLQHLHGEFSFTLEQLERTRSVCLDHCVPGCECVDGRIWSGDRCVPVEECGCIDVDGTYVPVSKRHIYFCYICVSTHQKGPVVSEDQN